MKQDLIDTSIGIKVSKNTKRSHLKYVKVPENYFEEGKLIEEEKKGPIEEDKESIEEPITARLHNFIDNSTRKMRAKINYRVDGPKIHSNDYMATMTEQFRRKFYL